MATPPSDDSKMLFRLLADGQWHPYHEIKAGVANAVPPGRAIRRYQDRLRQSRELRNQPASGEILRSEDEQIRLGAMSAAQVAMTSWKGRGIMVRGEGQFKEVRVKPGFSLYGTENGEEPGAEAQEPGKEGEGLPEVPPSDSEPSEERPDPVEAPSEFQPDPQPAEPVVAALDPEVAVIEPDLIAEPIPQEFVAPTEETPVPDDQSQTVNYWEIVSCPECGMGILDQPMHDRWHRDLKKVLEAPGSAFVDTETLRTLFEEVMRQGLARFQSGLQGYLDEEFSQVKQRIRTAGIPRSAPPRWY
jgi:hypothetical protein